MDVRVVPFAENTLLNRYRFPDLLRGARPDETGALLQDDDVRYSRAAPRGVALRPFS